MPQLDQLSACPGCGEPLAAADQACRSCGEKRRPAPAEPAADADFPLPPPRPDQPPAPAGADHGETTPDGGTPKGATPAASAPKGSERASDGPHAADADAGTAPPDPGVTPPAPAPPSPGAPGSAADGPARAAPGLPPQAGDGTPEPPPVPGDAPSSARASAADAATTDDAASGADAADTAAGATGNAQDLPDLPDHPDHPAAPDATPDDDTPAPPEATASATEREAGTPDPRRPDAELPAPEAPAPRCAVCGTGAVDEDGYCTDCGRAQPGDRDHVERSLGGVGCVTDLGKRHHRNEDAFSISATALPDGAPAVVAVVCDGVSSSSRPHEASAAAADAAGEALLAALPRGLSGREAMREALLTAGKAVNALADSEQEPGRNAPACTVVSAVTTGSELTVGWVGDSRAYWLPMEGDAHPIRLTEDDSWAAQMVKAGLLTEQEAMADRRAHAITAWLGADNPELDPHTASFKPDKPGVVVICTDGLWNYADSAEEMADRLPSTARSAPLDSARSLVRYALDSGGHDNVTVAVLPFPTPGLRAARTATGRAAELQAPFRTDTLPAVPRPPG